ncbi:hypothetical protein SAMN04489735_100244 [Aneurinibacillus thermoaerophilus]|uniref:Post-transcriptional regulator n=1 Tax=Aneurinibacillus thermoaerophilus TaxID=143495 RepID=A0A1G7WPF3_ANETH|nr:hypothetical protein [Aneurinibacillus thermoaerophilus]SDG73809.1 hypothetical protein SAMN04489735_100244 [Aneurinibacillus thermoaerophilus]
MKLTREEAWDYVLEYQNLIWAKIWNYNIYNKEDVFQEALIELHKRIQKHGIENISSQVRSAVVDSIKKQKNNSMDLNRLKESGVLAC